MNIVLGLFLVAHGLVHAMYAAQSMRLFEIQTGLTWPDGSWVLSSLAGDPAVRTGAGAVFVAIAAAFAVAGIALVFRQGWWAPVALVAAGVSAVSLVILWNGKMQALDTQGAWAIGINGAVFLAVLVFNWPRVGSGA